MKDENRSKRFRPVEFNFHTLIIALLLFISLTFTCGCRSSVSVDEGSPAEINVAAAANLTDAFNELGKEFTSRTGIRVVYSFGATAALAKQIEEGAPFDVFAAADVEHVEGLNNKKLLVPGTATIYARGRLVLWIPPGSRISINRIEEIKQSGVE